MQSVVRSWIAIACAFLLISRLGSTAMAESIKIWAQAPSSPGDSAPGPNLVAVTPFLDPAAAAGALATVPSGSRGLVMTGFAEDITAYDRLRVPRSRVTYQSPWLDVGTARVKVRVDSWLAAFRRAGGSADLVVIRPPSTFDWQRFAVVTLTGVKAIAADRRAPSLAAEMGLASVMDGSKASNAATWMRGMQMRFDRAVEAALTSAVSAHYPSATVVYARREAAAALASSPHGVGPSRGIALGTADLLKLNPGNSTDGFARAKSVVANIRSAIAASGRSIVPILQPKSAFDIAVGTRTTASIDGHWAEAAIHVTMSGVRDVMVAEGALSSSDAAALKAARASIRANVADTSLAAIRLSAPTGTDQVIASGMQAGSVQLWRITLPASMQSASFKLQDGTVATVRPAAGEFGAWFVSKQPAVPALNAGHSGLILVPEPAQAPSPFVLLADGSPTGSFVSPVSYDSKYLIVYQNNADPQAMITGIIDPEKVIAEIRRIQSIGVRSSWGVLDFEVPFDEVLMRGPTDSRFAAVTASLVSTMAAVKAAFPTMRWTYYGFPHVPYHPTAGDWGRVAAADRDALMQRYTQPYAAVLECMDWLMPCAYDVYERAKGMPNTYSQPDVAEVEFRRARVDSIVRHFTRRGLPVPPIIPAVSPWFQPGAGAGGATWLAPIPTEEFVSEQLRPCMAAGATGFAIWGGMDYILRIASLRNTPPTGGVSGLRTEFRSALMAAYPQGDRFGRSPGIDWSDPASLERLGAQLDATLAEAMRSSDCVAVEFGRDAPASYGMTVTRN